MSVEQESTLHDVISTCAPLEAAQSMRIMQFVLRQRSNDAIDSVVTINPTAVSLDSADIGCTDIAATSATNEDTGGEYRIGVLLVGLIFGRLAINERDATSPVVQELPTPVQALVARDLGVYSGQWVTGAEWLDTLTHVLGSEVIAPSPHERRQSRRSIVRHVAAAALIGGISLALVVYFTAF